MEGLFTDLIRKLFVWYSGHKSQTLTLLRGHSTRTTFLKPWFLLMKRFSKGRS